MRYQRPAFGACAVALAGLTLAAAATHHASRSEWTGAPTPQRRNVTFTHDIAPILFQTCTMCHRPSEAGPFPLLTFQDAKSHARQIASVTRRRYMPPWLPEPGELRFADELRLSEEQIAAIQEWVDEGAPEGNPGDLPPRPQLVEGWQLGKPDLILEAEKPYLLPASGSDTYWNFIFRTPVDRTRWLDGVEIRPGDKRLIHHANILVDRTQSARRQEAEPGAGFYGMELQIESEVFDPDSHFLFWKPGTVPSVEPEGMALRLDKDTDLVLNTHLQPSGKPELIQPRIGLYFTDRPATRFPVLLQMQNDRGLDIPPGEKSFHVTDDFTLPVDVDLLAIYPHAHYLGKDIQAFATLPDGKKETLIHIAHWDLNWQAVYRYEQPVPLPKGTIVSMRYTYDNSAENLANPNNPPRRVVAGNRSADEMAHLWLQVLPHASRSSEIDPRMVLQEALARHAVARNPQDFAAHYNLGAMLQARGELQEAIGHYELALRVRSDDAAVQNALGGALLAGNRVREAVEHLRAALKSRPDYFDAHYNLGLALASEGEYRAALEHFRAAVRLHPNDADAEANLGSALAVTGHLAEARQHFQRALEINPHHTLARENLEQLQQSKENTPK